METNIDANALKKLVDKKLGTEEDEDNSKYNCFEKLMKKVKRVSQKMEEKKN